jgi:hypothetical protein
VGSLRFKKDRLLQEMVSLAWSSVEKERGGGDRKGGRMSRAQSELRI